MLVVTTVVVVVCLAADVGLAHLAFGLWPRLSRYGHFDFSDYGTLTVLGVVPACLAWPAVVRLSSRPRRFFFRLACAVTAVGWIPDVWLLLRHQPVRAVGTLMAMHLAIALVAYNGLVRLAPPRHAEGPMPSLDVEELLRLGWITLVSLTCAEFVLGVVVLAVVPFGRPTGLVPRRDDVVYLLHAGVGGILGIGALVMLVLARAAQRAERIGAAAGLLGVVAGAVGGILSEAHQLRVGGMALMFVGTLLALFGYLAALIEPKPDEGAASRSSAKGAPS